jgi:serine/threonine protein kinase
MSDKKPNLDSLFAAAVELESASERAVFLDQACAGNLELRKQVELLLKSDQQAGSFLEKPPAEFEQTMLHDGSANLAASLDAGLAAAFDLDQALVMGSAGHSVFKVMGQTIDIPRVVLRESTAEGSAPITRSKSPEMPKGNSDNRYRLDGEIARGGMGAILKGRDTDLGRDLAIKVLLDQHKNKPEVVQRFIEEAQIGGQLQHPGIAPIYELGQFADKRPFFSMKLVKGKTLANLLADREDAVEDRGRFIGIFEQICQTMAYAHSRGVIHRDLKPANIMVGAFGEVQVMDWGLAKVLPTDGVADEKTAHDKQQGQSIIQTLRTKVGSDVPGTVGSLGTFGSHTQMGSVMGTPAYMPPEQALGEIDHLDERADVFGLGAILCEILTGKPPYVGDDGTKVYRMASRGKLEDCFQRLDACGADAELIALTKHCLELELQNRPRNADVLAERVTGYLESVETKLRETERAKFDAQVRAEELRRRQKLVYSAGAAIAASLLIGMGVSLWQMWRAEREKSRATDAEQKAIAQAERATKAEAVAVQR